MLQCNNNVREFMSQSNVYDLLLTITVQNRIIILSFNESNNIGENEKRRVENI
jgi:hypothetical protein